MTHSISITVGGESPASQVENVNDPELAASILREWKGNATLRAEFGDELSVYAAYRQAEAAGKVRPGGRAKD